MIHGTHEQRYDTARGISVERHEAMYTMDSVADRSTPVAGCLIRRRCGTAVRVWQGHKVPMPPPPGKRSGGVLTITRACVSGAANAGTHEQRQQHDGARDTGRKQRAQAPLAAAGRAAPRAGARGLPRAPAGTRTRFHPSSPTLTIFISPALIKRVARS